MNDNFFTPEELKCFASCGEKVLVDRTVVLINPANIHLGNKVRIDAFTVLNASAFEIVIGSYIHISSHCQLAASGGKIEMQDFSGLSSRVSIFTASDDYVGGSLTNPMLPNQYKKMKYGPVSLQKHVIIGCGTVIMPNLTLGIGSAVGALSFVNKNVYEYTVVSGHPAKKICDRNKEALLENELKFLEEQK